MSGELCPSPSFGNEGSGLKQRIMGVEFDNVTLDEAIDRGCALMESEGWHYVVTPNSEIVYACREKPELQPVLNGASLVLPDGIGVVYASRILKVPVKQKVAGIEFGSGMLAKAAEKGWRIYLLGSKPGVADEAAVKLAEKYPGLNVVGTADGYFKEDGPVVEKIRAAQPDILFVCLGAPKQEFWMAANGEATGAKLLVGLGGSLDIYSGNSKRAPDIWVKLGLEWAYRLVKEPWRIGRQMNLPKFLFSAIGLRLRGRTE